MVVHYSKDIQIQFTIKYKFQIKFIFSKPSYENGL